MQSLQGNGGGNGATYKAPKSSITNTLQRSYGSTPSGKNADGLGAFKAVGSTLNKTPSQLMGKSSGSTKSKSTSSKTTAPSYYTTTAKPIPDSTNSGYNAWQNAQAPKKSTIANTGTRTASYSNASAKSSSGVYPSSHPSYKTDSAGRPIYNGTAASRTAQSSYDAAHPVSSTGRPVYNGTSASRLAQNGYDAAHPAITSKAPVAPAHPAATHQSISGADSTWYNKYSGSLVNGNADTSQYQHYLDLQSKYGLKNYTMNDTNLHNMSIKALSGDVNAQNYLKATHQNQQTAQQGLWNGFNQNQFNNSQGLRAAYMKDNPTADMTKAYDMNTYNTYGNNILNNKPMDAQQMDAYNSAAGKWGLQNMNDPFQRQQYTLGQDKQTALNAQDTALNQGLATQDANNFQDFNKLQQQESNNGMGNSGIAANMYMQSQMAANQNYQKAYADSAQAKSDINNTYDTAMSNSQIDGQKYQDSRSDALVKQASDMATAQAELQKNQTAQDQYLTSSTGMVYMNGKPLLDKSGKPISSMDYAKLSETVRHDYATENNTAQSNSNTYNLGMANVGVKQQQIQADLTKSLAQNKLDYAKLDYNYAALGERTQQAQDQIKIASDNAQTAADKNKIDALGKQYSSYSSQIQAYQKAGQKPPKALVDNFNSIGAQLSNFNYSSGGGGSSVKGTASFNSNLAKANQLGVPSSANADLTWIAQHESGLDPNAKNPSSSAHGYAQFINSTQRQYEKETGMSYSDPVGQLYMMYRYTVERYGSPANAKAFWEKNHWY